MDNKDDQHTSPSKQQTKEKQVVCEECKANPSKYKCPGCSIRTCSLPCVKAHKQRRGCSGKRDKTQFIPLSQFDDNALASDYFMLEDVKRIAESAQRLRTKVCPYPGFKLPFPLKSLRGASASRRMKVLFLPSGMSRREKNKSRYDQKKKCIHWTIEWRFHSTDVVILDHGVNEENTFSSVIKNHLEPGPWKNRLRQFCEEHPDNLKLFIRKCNKGPKSPFRELDMNAPIRQQLANLVILEYPTIHVFLPSHTYDFEVIKEAPKHKPGNREPDGVDQHIPKGITFREEEIGGSDLDPKVLDLKKHVSSPIPQNPLFNRARKPIDDSSDGALLPEVAVVGSCSQSGGPPDVFEDMDIEFDQGILDAYSDLIAEMNPDDFLDFEAEGEDANELQVADGRSSSSVKEFPVAEEEPEEGEILE